MNIFQIFILIDGNTLFFNMIIKSLF